MTTPYHSQYWAHALTLRGSGGDIAAFSRSIANARVDLNPHQIDAALFAVRSPFTNGAILADEVAWGKPWRPASCWRKNGPNGVAAS